MERWGTVSAGSHACLRRAPSKHRCLGSFCMEHAGADVEGMPRGRSSTREWWDNCPTVTQ